MEQRDREVMRDCDTELCAMAIANYVKQCPIGRQRLARMMPSETTVEAHGRYTIRSAKIAGAFGAQSFRNARPVGDRVTAAARDLAVSAVKAALDARDLAERGERDADGSPSSQAYREAFESIDLNRSERAMLEAHFEAEAHTLTATQLAEAAGWADWSSANLHYGKLGRRIAEALEWTPPRRDDGSVVWTMAIARPAHDALAKENDEHITLEELMRNVEHAGEFEWTLRPQVIALLGG